MKNKKAFAILIILIICIYFYRNEIYKIIYLYNLKLMQEISQNIKSLKIKNLYIIIFIYGIIHSLTPGHGKVYLLNLSIKKSKLYLIFISGLIAYVQGIISYFLVKFFLTSFVQLKNIDFFSKNIYGVTLILLGLFNLYHNLKDDKIHTEKFLVGTFFPCSGLISVLLVGYIYKSDIKLIYLTLVMSSGIFFTLVIFSLICKKITLLATEDNFMKRIEIFISFLILIIGGCLINFKYY